VAVLEYLMVENVGDLFVYFDVLGATNYIPAP
jgi:hypothetical protein